MGIDVWFRDCGRLSDYDLAASCAELSGQDLFAIWRVSFMLSKLWKILHYGILPAINLCGVNSASAVDWIFQAFSSIMFHEFASKGAGAFPGFNL
jgi:hypothetical protein